MFAALTSAVVLRTDLHISDIITRFYTSNPGQAPHNLDWYESAIARPALVLNDLAAAAGASHLNLTVRS